MKTLEERYKDNLELLEYYKRKLLEPGWAGAIDQAELQYIRTCLWRDKRLRRKWGKGRKMLSEKEIRLVARYGTEALENAPQTNQPPND